MDTQPQNPSQSCFPVIRRGRKLYRLVPQLPSPGGRGKHLPSKPGETRAEALRRGKIEPDKPALLRQVALERLPGERKLCAAWRNLTHLPATRSEIVSSLWLVLENTTPAADVRQTMPLPVLREGLDITPWLMDRLALAQLLSCVDPDGGTSDPWALARWGEHVDVRQSPFTSWFSGTLLPFVSDGRRDVALEIEEIARVLALHGRPAMLALVAELLRTVSAPRALQWLRYLAEEEVDRQEWLLGILIESGHAPAVVADQRLVSVLRTWRRLTPHPEGKSREVAEFRMLLRGIAGGASSKYLLYDLELGRKYSLDLPKRIYAGRDVLSARLTAFFESHSSPYTLRLLWQACGRLPGLVVALEKLELRRHWRYSILNFIEILMDCPGGAPIGSKRRVQREHWDYFAEVVDELRYFLFRLPLQQRYSLLDYITVVRKSPRLCGDAELRKEFLETAKTLCLLSEDAGDEAPIVWAVLAKAHRVGENRLAAIPTSAWGKVIKACASTNRGRLLEDGFAWIGKADPLTVIEGLTHFPSLTLELARAFGAPVHEVVAKVVGIFAEHPLVGVDLSKLSLRDAVALVDSTALYRAAEGTPTPLRVHLDGGRQLRQDRFEHYREELDKNAARLRLMILGELLEAELKRAALGHADAALPQHTLLFAHHIDENERVLRSYLRQRVWGGEDGRLDHPTNRRWLDSQRGQFDVPAWLGNLEGTTSVDPIGEVTFALEDDPDEVLKMGTYVGSCLGLGGLFSHSAVAVLLDANKRVVYARNRRGRVVGRQLVAVSKGRNLVCFDVYGNASDALLMAFKAFDQSLAENLRLPLQRGDDYEIETLVAPEWYDDGAWDFSVEA